jgi:hypothetical protein
MTVDDTLRGLEYANLALCVILVGRLLQTGLFRPYHFFFIYQAYDALQSLFAFHQFKTERAGLLAYIGFQIPKLITSALVVLEIYRLSLERHPAIDKFSRKIVLYVFGACVLVSMVGVYYTHPLPREELRVYFFAILRSFDAANLLFLAVMGAFLLWFPIRLRRNLVAYVLGYVVYFASQAALLTYGILAHNVRQKQINNIAFYAITLVCLGFWIRSMQPEGEQKTTVTGHWWNPEENQRLIEKLDEINNTLERMAK